MSDRPPPPVTFIACLSILLLFAFPQISHAQSATRQLEELTRPIERDSVRGQEGQETVLHQKYLQGEEKRQNQMQTRAYERAYDWYFNLGIQALNQKNPYNPETCFRKAIEIRPTGAAYNNLGVAFDRQGRYEEAREAFRQALNLGDGNARNNLQQLEDHNRRQNAATYLKHGDALRKQGRYKEAEEAYRQALKLDPQDETAYFNLGDSLLSQKRYKEAEEAIRQALKLDPKDDNAYNLLGLSLLEQKRYKEVEEAIRQALKLNPKNDTAYSLLGISFLEQKRYKEAEEAYRQALKLNPKNDLACKSLQELESQKLTPQTPAVTAEEARKGGSKEATKQAESAQFHGRKAAGEANKVSGKDITVNPLTRPTPMEEASEEASKPFSRPGQDVGTTLKPGAVGGGYPGREPVIPKGQRTGAITILEKERDEAKSKRVELEQKVSEMGKKAQKTSEETVKLVELKQELYVSKNKENFLNFAITEELRKTKKPSIDNEKEVEVSKPKKVTADDEDE